MSGRGSRGYRKFKYEGIRPIKTLWEHLEIGIEEGLLRCGMELWTVREVDTEFRQYMFRWNQGMIHGNTVISHFGEVDRKCTLCKIVKREEREREVGRELTVIEEANLDAVDENRKHIFWECVHVNRCIQTVYNGVWNTVNNVEKKDFLMGKDMGNMEATKLYMMTNMYIKFRIWKYKLAGVMPKPNCILNDTREWINTISMYRKWRMMLPLIQRQLNM